MTVYTKSFKHNREIYKKASLLDRFLEFLERHELILTIIGVALFITIIFFASIAFGNPITDSK